MTHHDLAGRWDHVLTGLDYARRTAILKALKNSEETGYPANVEGVQLLVAFARGQISARQYSARILESLGFSSARPAPTPSYVAWSSTRREDSLQMPSLQPRPRVSAAGYSAPPAASTYDPLGHTARPSETGQDTVQMYLSGQIPMDEFLRRQQARTSV